jgi:hypothetical protein
MTRRTRVYADRARLDGHWPEVFCEACLCARRGVLNLCKSALSESSVFRGYSAHRRKNLPLSFHPEGTERGYRVALRIHTDPPHGFDIERVPDRNRGVARHIAMDVTTPNLEHKLVPGA